MDQQDSKDIVSPSSEMGKGEIGNADEKENNVTKPSPTNSCTPDTDTNSSFEDLHGEDLSQFEEGKIEDDDEWADVLGSGRIMKKIIKKAPEQKRPTRGDISFIRLKGSLDDGTVVEDYEKLEIQIGDLEIVPGLDLMIPMMNVGEITLLKIEPELAYGDQGSLPEIPANATIEYEVEVLEILPETEPRLMSAKERKIIGNKKRERGNFWYLRNECNYAVQCYRRALEYLDEAEGGMTDPTEDGELTPTDAELQDLLEDRIKVYNNIAAAQMKMGSFDAALKSVNNVLQCQPNNVKALFRKAKILHSLKEPKEAMAVLKKAIALDPTNQAILHEQQRLYVLAQNEHNKEKLLAKRMFGSGDKAEGKKKKPPTRSKYFYLLAPLIGIIGIGIAVIAAYKLRAS